MDLRRRHGPTGIDQRVEDEPRLLAGIDAHNGDLNDPVEASCKAGGFEVDDCDGGIRDAAVLNAVCHVTQEEMRTMIDRNVFESLGRSA